MSSDSAWVGIGVGVIAGLLGLVAIENIKKTQQLVNVPTTAVPEVNNLPSIPLGPEGDMVRKIFDLMEREHHAEAVTYACKILFGMIRNKSGVDDKDTMALVDHVFSPKKPILQFIKHQDHKHLDTHEGYYYLLKGISSAFRNPAAHGDIQLSKREAALQIGLIAHLYDVVDAHSVLVKQVAA